MPATSGLYVPAEWPQLDRETIAGLAGKPYHEVAFEVIRPFVGDAMPAAVLADMLRDTYAAFRHPAVTPLVQVADNRFVLELFHGPTLAFKDVAMQLLGRLMDHVLAERDQRATIVGATSGDTGGAAIEAFRGRERTDIFILFPDGRVSDVQRRQMTTASEANVHALALEGNFDDCQAMLKGMFNHFAFRDKVGLAGVNSINWARIVAQVVYYFVAGVAVGAPHRPVSFTVPTGNFGDIFAGYVAARMGLPIEKLVIATNVNDILARTLETGRYETRGVTATTSPSMDIQVSSNFERLLFEVAGRDAEAVRRQMDGLSQSGAFDLSPESLKEIRKLFSRRPRRRGGRRRDHRPAPGARPAIWPIRTPPWACPSPRRKARRTTPMIVLSTAHPAKFPDAVKAASGVTPGLPDWLSDLMERKERFEVVPNDNRGS